MNFAKIIFGGLLALAFANAGAVDKELQDNRTNLRPAIVDNPPGCLQSSIANLTPFSDDDTWVFNVDNKFEMEFWREPCTNRDAALLVRITPLVSNSPFVCSDNLSAVQDGVRHDGFILARTPEVNSSDLCDSLSLSRTFSVELGESNGGVFFDNDEPFAIHYEYLGVSESADIGPYVVGAIQNGHAGTWYNPSRSGEGFMIEIFDTDPPVMFVTWYTHFGGNQMWLAGNTSYQPGDTSITVALEQPEGTGFGANFNSNEIFRRAWGSVTLSRIFCDQFDLSYNGIDGSGASVQIRIAPSAGRVCID